MWKDSRLANAFVRTTPNCAMSVSTAVVVSCCSASTSRHTVSPWVRRPHSAWSSSFSDNILDGGFAEYCAYPAGKVFKLHNLSDVDATLLEPASCAAHGLDKISPKLGSSVLMFGAGPTGLVLSQMLRQVRNATSYSEPIPALHIWVYWKLTDTS